MTIAGIALLGAGLIGFLPDNPIASSDPDALFRVNAAHNVVHLITGALALWIGMGMRGRELANATIGFGVLYAVVAVLLILDPTLFGLFSDAPANGLDHALHAVLAIVSIALGSMARQRMETRSSSR
jgi:membrane associated rhomboid family serine protease